MNFVKTLYLRVSEKNVMPVEFHELCESEIGHASTTWLNDYHIQEILQLMQGTIKSFTEFGVVKKQATSNKQHNKLADIVTGSSVRIGYVFRSRHSNQTCLVDSSVLGNMGQYEEDEPFRSFSVLKNKLVVYAHKTVSGSLKGSAQLMKLMKEKRASSESMGASISNYFHKIPTQTASLSSLYSYSKSASQNENICSIKSVNQTSKTAESLPVSGTRLKDAGKQLGISNTGNHDMAAESLQVPSLPPAPPSDGRRSKIKNILERRDNAKTRKKKLTVRSTRSKSETGDQLKNRNTDSNIGSSNENCPQTSDIKTGVLNIGKTKQPEKCIIGDVTISTVENPCIDLDCEPESGSSVTLISVEQVNEIQKINGAQPRDKRKEDNQSMSHDISDQSDSSGDNLSDLPSASFCISSPRVKKRRLTRK